jgi:hypothetical protein
MNEHAKPPFPKQKQPMPGKTEAMDPVPDHGENSYSGSGRLAGKKAIITGADSGIGERLRSPMRARVPTCSFPISASTTMPRKPRGS